MGRETGHSRSDGIPRGPVVAVRSVTNGRPYHLHAAACVFELWRSLLVWMDGCVNVVTGPGVFAHVRVYMRVYPSVAIQYIQT